MRVLMTGFDPFGGESVNPSWEAAVGVAEALPDAAARRLPVVFGAAGAALREAVAEVRPALVVCLGQAGGRAELSVERVAVNVDDASIADNAGARPVDEPVVPGGPAAYFSGLPVKACVAASRAAGVPAAVSQSAGTFVCNHVFYRLMHLAATEGPGLRGGFVHVPYAPGQVADGSRGPSMEVASMVRGVAAMIAAACGTPAGTDLRAPGGAVS
ncbi:pyroglutamyl-peptidase I [Mangrovactinospora gilvigrisea]|uniref:Pyrrolidone-carboxylate peptidase n=1 Tax=Mangrovactinospora gilvigrisea TaxID=1428644 RepID=A0A1J7BAC6_9ACTN|nr:pyroglutamyl-peptidase I [Mangrovactinospora gilvigrisea]OIV35647.1 pyroglutamyl-peptidase I [Mangrovactinospora gilvigrisea]